MWTAYIAETTTGRILDEFPVTAHSWANSLEYGKDTSGSVTIPLDAPTRGADPKIRLRVWTGSPWRYTIILAYNDSAVWAGPYTDYQYDGDATLSVGCVGLKKLLDRRIVVKPGYETKLADPASDLKWEKTSLQHIAAELMNTMTTGKTEPLPIKFTPYGTTGIHQRHYISTDLATADERIKQLTEVIDGPDTVIEPMLAGDKLSFWWHITFGNPDLFRTQSPHQFTCDGNVTSIAETYDATEMVNRTWVPGQAEQDSGSDDRNKPVGYATSDTWTQFGWPRMETVDTSHNSTKDITVLNKHAQNLLRKYEKPVETWTLTVDATRYPELGTWHIGDEINIHVSGDHWIPDGHYKRRITACSGDASDFVKLDTQPVEGRLKGR